jgi:hypothetical protein
MAMIDLTKRPPRRRNETRDVVKPIMAALNRLPGVRVVRNHNVGAVVPFHKRLSPNPPRFVAGLGLGSSDLVGIVCVDVTAWQPMPPSPWPFGRVFCLEVKLPSDSGRAGSIRPDQVRWLAVVRRLGGFAAVVHSVAEALAAVERCRLGHSS